MEKIDKILNLHVHSHFSILDSLSTPEQIIKKTVEFKLPGVAITDHGNMNNYGHFYLGAKEAGIKPILGCEFYFISSVKKWKEKNEKVKNDKKLKQQERKDQLKKINKRYHLLILVKNKIGFENINLLIHESYKNFYYRPRIDRKLLKKHSNGLICSSACIAGEVQQAILQNKSIKYIDKIINFYKDIFGDDYYLEIQINEMQDQKTVNKVLFQLAEKHRIKIILTGDSHYTNQEDQRTHQTLLLMNSKSTYEDLKNKKLGDMNSGAWEFDTKRLFFKNYEEYNKDRLELNPEITQKQFDWTCENTFDVYKKVENFEIDNAVKLKDVNPEIKDKNKQLKIECVKKLKELNLYENKKYRKRLMFELDVINRKKLEDYFFVVKFIVDYATKNMKMLVGPGRGSSAGSIVAYLLGITQIDPLRYNLYFERFLDIEREDYADIDIDFEDNDKVKEWILEKYKNESACVSSFNSFVVLGLIKDLGRVYGIEDAQYWNGVTKNITKELDNENLEIKKLMYDQIFENSETFKKIMKQYKNNLAFDMKNLMGKYKYIGRHASGLIISKNLIKKQPLLIIKDKKTKKNFIQTSLTEGMQDQTLSKFGFIKIDILGLKTLKVIHETVKIVSRNNKYKKEKLLKRIHPDNINLKLKKVFKNIFKIKNLSGIFQFDTDSASQVIEKIRPETFQDLIAINALNRPGPKQFVSLYADRKRKIKKVKYDHPFLKNILKETQGIILFQEQVMEIAKQMAGYTLSEANNLRKAMGKKIEELMHQHKSKFIKGCVSNKINIKLAKNLFIKIEEFAKYSFNKSHAVSYSMIGYQCAYLKTLFPLEFYTSVLRVESLKKKVGYEIRIEKTIKEMKKNGIEIELLDIVKSGRTFKIIDRKIYHGFSNVKGIGEKAADTIIKARRKKEINTFKDFLTNEYIDRRVCNKRVAEILIKSFVFGKNIEKKLEFFLWFQDAKNKAKNKTLEMIYEDCKKGFDYLIQSGEIKIKKLTSVEKMKIEKKLYGTNIIFSCFDINKRRDKINKLLKMEKAGGFIDNYDYIIVKFKNISVIQDKNNNSMAFLNLEDIYGETRSGLIFASNFNENNIEEDGIYCVQGSREDKFIIDINRNIDNLFNK